MAAKERGKEAWTSFNFSGAVLRDGLAIRPRERYNDAQTICQREETTMCTAAVLPEAKANENIDDYDHYEIVDGQRVELPPTGAYQSVLASYLGQILGSFALTKDLGRVVVETLFQLDREGKLQRTP